MSVTASVMIDRVQVAAAVDRVVAAKNGNRIVSVGAGERLAAGRPGIVGQCGISPQDNSINGIRK